MRFNMNHPGTYTAYKVSKVEISGKLFRTLRLKDKVIMIYDEENNTVKLSPNYSDKAILAINIALSQLHKGVQIQQIRNTLIIHNTQLDIVQIFQDGMTLQL